MRLALAVEVDVPDDLDLRILTLSPRLVLHAGVMTLACKVVRYEIHPDPDAVFADQG